jgi:hypothetical protein
MDDTDAEHLVADPHVAVTVTQAADTTTEKPEDGDAGGGHTTNRRK